MIISLMRAARTRTPLLCASALLTTAVLISPACGKKGPPLAPLLRIPAAADRIAARRLGETVYVDFTIPARNQDNSTPGDVSRVDVYGYTGTPENDDDLVKNGTLVATLPVRKPVSPEEEDRRRERPETSSVPGTIAPGKAVQPEPGFDQGATVTVTETLTPALMKPVVRKAPATAVATAAARTVTATRQALTRIYVAVAFNHRGRRGMPSRRAAVPLENMPSAPPQPAISYTETQITVSWAEAPGAAVANRTVAADQPSAARAANAAPGFTYNVYAVPPGSEQAARPEVFRGAGTESGPHPINDKPLTEPSFVERVTFDQERCYTVRTVAVDGVLHEESEPSAVACVTPKDTFPPAAPKGLTAVASAGTISLLWEPNTESDLAGYLVLRGEAPGVKLQPLTPQPIHETTFNDTAAKAGVRYLYAVVAVDKVGNIGAQSNTVEETAR